MQKPSVFKADVYSAVIFTGSRPSDGRKRFRSSLDAPLTVTNDPTSFPSAARFTFCSCSPILHFFPFTKPTRDGDAAVIVCKTDTPGSDPVDDGVESLPVDAVGETLFVGTPLRSLTRDNELPLIPPPPVTTLPLPPRFRGNNL